MNNYKLIIQYDGTDFAGWQIQNNAPTIQQNIQDAIRMISREEIKLIGAGRTDSGVHAFGQTANFRISKELNLNKFFHSLNSVLPREISISHIEKVEDSFHSRFDAKKRSYFYFISREKSPFLYRFSYYINKNTNIDVKKLNQNAQEFLGKKDFTSFSKKNTDVMNNICELFEIRFTEKKNMIIFYVVANRFLHGMVRAILGSLLESLKYEDGGEYLKNIFEKKDRDFAGMAVPAKGLFLYKIQY